MGTSLVHLRTMVTRSSDYVLAVVTGLLLTLSFPKIGHPAFAWIALTPLLVALDRQPSWRAFVLGLVSGVVFFVGTVYWITGVMVVYGGLNVVAAVLVNGALIAYLAIFPAAFALAISWLRRAGDYRTLLIAPFVWVATELGRTYVLSGFPWVLLGYSQVSVLPVVQVASLAGVYGVSALVASVGAALAVLAVGSDRGLRERTMPLAVTLLIVIGLSVWGNLRLVRSDLTRAGTPIRVGLIQGNVDQAEKWDARRATQIFQNYLHLSAQAIDQGVDMVLWPESSTPFLFEEDRAEAEEVRALARRANVPILLGSDQIDRRGGPRYYNSAFLVDPSGRNAGVYRKVHLVPFGEYVPFKRLLFFAAPLVEAVSDFSAGDGPTLLPLGGHRISTAICYEIVYPNLVRQFVEGGSELLTAITNDAWFGRTAAPFQHFAQAAMRAVENGRYLVRSANTGISGVVDPYGRVLSETALFEQVVVVGEARLLRESTVYSRTGDVFAYVSAAATLVLLVLTRGHGGAGVGRRSARVQ
jgi:apolipoprotein N-acyltransferase